MERNFITVVSGLPRSGTSMMMQMLEAGGLAPLTDHVREADDDNPRGYYEFEPVKKTKDDASWVAWARGKAVKMIYLLLYDLPGDQDYRLIFMQRDIREVVKSQSIMLGHRGQKGADLKQDKMAKVFAAELRKFESWLTGQSCFCVLRVDYKAVIDDPSAESERVSEFLGGGLDTAAMAAVVDAKLYRSRF